MKDLMCIPIQSQVCSQFQWTLPSFLSVQSLSEAELKLKKSKLYFDGLHFDWSWFESSLHADGEMLTILRNPVKRAISHFFYAKDRKVFGKNHAEITLDAFFSDVKMMMENRGIWQDGQAAVSWIAGYTDEFLY